MELLLGKACSPGAPAVKSSAADNYLVDTQTNIVVARDTTT